MQHTVTRKRHIAKAFTWRITGTVTTFVMVWILTGKLTFGLAVGSSEAAVKMVLYYIHERAWHRSKFGIIETDNTLEQEISA